MKTSSFAQHFGQHRREQSYGTNQFFPRLPLRTQKGDARSEFLQVDIWTNGKLKTFQLYLGKSPSE